jgi:hypothetical protein
VDSSANAPVSRLFGAATVVAIASLEEALAMRLGVRSTVRRVDIHIHVARHIAARRPAEVEFVLAHLEWAIRDPQLVGRAPDRPDRLHLVRAVGAGAWLHVVVKHVGAHRSASTTDELWVSTAYRVGEASLRRLTKRITLLPNTLERQR